MDLHVEYLQPTKEDICVAFCFFNSCGYIRPLQNLLFFENKLKAAKIPYFSIEMVIGDQVPLLANPTLRVHSKSSLFYKESLWNRLEQEIPSKYTKICFLDSDIIFQNPDWLDSLSILLDTHEIVHPFHILTYLNMSYNELKVGIASSQTVSFIARESITNNSITNSVPGLGWAIRRSFFSKIGGFYDMNMLGSSDRIFCGCILKDLNFIKSSLYPCVYESAMSYYTKIKELDYSYSYLFCNTLHLYHGTFKNRKYSTRADIIKNIQTPWDSLFSKNADGFWELLDDSLNAKFHEYFIDRNEDDADNSQSPPLNIQYTEPSNKDICVAFVFFNPCGYIRPIQNLLLFENKLKLAGIPYFSAEMVIGNQKPALANPTLRFYSKSALFYKEGLWNRLEKEIPSEYTKICFLDSDIIFDKPDWIDRVSELLDMNDLVHPFETTHLLNDSYRIDRKGISAVCSLDNTKHPGYGWAIRRDFFLMIGGFFDRCILGGGDSVFYDSIFSVKCTIPNNPMSILINDAYIEYRSQLQSMNPKVTHLNCNLYHLFHGNRINRQYTSRYDILKDLNWGSLFCKNSHGFWECTNTHINTQCLEYFKNRNDDSTSDRKSAISSKYANRSAANQMLLARQKPFDTQTPYARQPPVAREASVVREAPVNTIPYLGSRIQARTVVLPSVNLATRAKSQSIASIASARSLEKRQSIYNKVVYNRILPPKDPGYSDSD